MNNLKKAKEMYLCELTKETIEGAHEEMECLDDYCPVCNPSSHHMAKWPKAWNEEKELIERVCWHGNHHPDPDDSSSIGSIPLVHDCDGCCNPDPQQPTVPQ